MDQAYLNLAVIDAYVKMGISIIPLKTKSKIPLIDWKQYQHVRPNRPQVFDWFKEYPGANIGAIMGAVSGNIFAVDIDKRNGGLDTMKSLLLPATFTTQTGGGGFHYLYRYTETIRKQTGILPGIDLIADGGYCVMPPSIHESGNQYKILHDFPFCNAPNWIYELQQNSNSKTFPPTNAEHSIIPIGQRHDSIKRSVRGYAVDTRHSFILLWKRASALVLQCTEVSTQNLFTISELVNICLWAWNEAHAQNQLAHVTAWKMLARRYKNKGDIVFGPATSSIHSFHLKQLTPQQPNTSTSQSDTVTYKYIQEETCQ